MENTVTEKQIKVLFLASEPSDTGKLRLGKELQEIKNRISVSQSQFDLLERHAVKPDDVQQTILSYKPQIVHFSGHGGESGEIYFEDEYGKSKVVPPEALAELFSLVKDYVKCVVINTCYSDKQAEAIAQYVPIVVGTKKEISDGAAIKFSTGFYGALATSQDLSHQNLKDAYTSGRIAIKFENLPEDLTPIIKEGLPEIKFSSEVDTALASVTKPKGYVFQALVRGLTLTGRKMGLDDATVNQIIETKIDNLESYNEGIEEYEKYLKEILRDEYPLTDQSTVALLQLQNGLGLKNEDVARIKDKILQDSIQGTAEKWYDRGRGQNDLGEFEKAIEYLTKAIQRDSDYSGAFFERAFSYYRSQRYESATENFTKAIEFDNKWEAGTSLSLAYHTRGLCYFSTVTENENEKKQLVMKAIADWSEALEINPNMPEAFHNKGLAFETLGETNKAISEYKKAYELYEIDQNDAWMKTTAQRLSKCYTVISNTEEAKKWGKLGGLKWGEV